MKGGREKGRKEGRKICSSNVKYSWSKVVGKWDMKMFTTVKIYAWGEDRMK
jgi:hypothetical protein